MGLQGRMPRVVACGPRRNAYDDFRTAMAGANADDFIMLLVDSEREVASGDGPWEHLEKHDNWTRPTSATDDSAHLMVQCMEAWFVADRKALEKYFGQGFNAGKLPKRNDVENIPKNDLYRAIENATRSSGKGQYGKGRHSFDILKDLDPEKVTDASFYARRLADTLRDKTRNVSTSKP